MAEKLGQPASELKHKFRPRDFFAYREYIRIQQQADFDKEWKGRHRSDYYYAQIAWEIYLLRHVVSNLFSKAPSKPEMRLKDFLLDFKSGLDVVKEAESEEVQYQRRLIESAIQKDIVAQHLGVRVPLAS